MRLVTGFKTPHVLRTDLTVIRVEMLFFITTKLYQRISICQVIVLMNLQQENRNIVRRQHDYGNSHRLRIQYLIPKVKMLSEEKSLIQSRKNILTICSYRNSIRESQSVT